MWDGEPAVTIGGTNYTGQTLNNAQFSFGAPDFLAGVQPPFGTITLVNTTSSPLPIYLSDDVVVTVWNHGKTLRRTLFTGVISDVSVSLIADDVAFYDITVVGNSQFFEPRIINELGFPLQEDFGRFQSLIKAGTGTPIDLITGTIDAQVGTISAYPSYLGPSLAVSPGSRVLPLPPGASTAGQLIADFASQTSGWVWEARDGLIYFRPFDQLSTTTITVSPEIVYLNRLRRTSTLTELYNQIEIIKNENEPESSIAPENYVKQDFTSTGSYGTRNYSVVTQYEFGAIVSQNWEPQADYLLDYLANNIQQLDGLTVDLTSDILVAATRNPLLNIDMTQTINFDLPDDIFDGGTGSGRVCGWTWNIADKILDLTLNLVKVE